ncbi:MAG: helix-hairpin-helix domain-containing protein [Candidatus Omnitrophica bacterium]|nr:helix-hairpin-helix domain-containing protein [Candidatus Omnitrophota bacterium]
MFCLTPQERKVIFLIAGLILLGGILRFLNTDKINKIFLENASKTSAEEASGRQILININKADRGQLELLPGIGTVTAERIINYRSDYGIFKSFEDLEKVKGIGSEKAKNLAELIVF